VRWRDDVPFEVVCTYPVQPRLPLEFTLALEKGALHCWGEGWAFEGAEVGRPDKGMHGDLDQALDALIEGLGRVVIRTAYQAPAPFWVALQVFKDDRWGRSGVVPGYRGRLSGGAGF
jgi:phenylpyruvate tautomerase PptA (4-oxalocrotonate tautomerase family)